MTALQARAVWQWSNFLHKQIEVRRSPLRINMDETGVCLHQASRAGLVTSTARRLRRMPRSLARQATRQQMRTMISLIAFVCDDAALQKKLPQILVVRATSTNARDVAQMRAALPPNVSLWIETRAWTTSDVMVRAARTLHVALQEHLSGRQVILSSDVFRAHMTKDVWRIMANLNFLYFLIPAKMTWVLQPCDTHVFATLKRNLADALQKEVVKEIAGKVTMMTLMKALGETIETVLRGRSWSKAFQDIGLVGHQGTVSASVLAKLQFDVVPLVDNSLPTLRQLKDIWPANSDIPIDHVFAGVVKLMRQRNGHDNTDALSTSSDKPWIGRLRSSSRAPPSLPSSSSTAWPLPMGPPCTAMPPPRMAPMARPLWSGVSLQPNLHQHQRCSQETRGS